MAGLTTKTRGISLPAFTGASVNSVYVDTTPFFPLAARLALTAGSPSTFANGVVAWIMRQAGSVETQVAFDAYPLAGTVVRRPKWWALLLGQEAVRGLLALPGPYSLHVAFDPLGDANVGRYSWAADVTVVR